MFIWFCMYFEIYILKIKPRYNETMQYIACIVKFPFLHFYLTFVFMYIKWNFIIDFSLTGVFPMKNITF